MQEDKVTTTKGKRVLIIEDAPDLQLLLGRVLEKEGFQVSHAYNGQEALDLLGPARELPSFILLDIMMPVMDGLEFRRLQKQDERLGSIPVVAMTAYSDPQSFASKLGVSKVLKKPISIDDLLAAVETLEAFEN